MYWAFAVVFFWSSQFTLQDSGLVRSWYTFGWVLKPCLLFYFLACCPGRQLDHALYLRFVNIGEGLLLTLGLAIVRRYECYNFFGRFANS